MIVVIPTNRAIRLDYLEPLIEAGARFIVVDDSEGSIRVDHPSFAVYTWADRRRVLGALEVAIPKGNGACRDFGFLLAWKESDDDEVIVALDDDCMVYHEDFAEQVNNALSSERRAIATTEQRHLNIMDFYSNTPDHLFPRGFPYSARGHYHPCSFEEAEPGHVAFSLGLWKGVFDINAIDKLEGPQWFHQDAELHYKSVIIPKGTLVSVCSMNMQFRRKVLPAVYQLPMNIEVIPGWVIDRYGDIWGGFILKTLMDLRGEAMVAGEPMIHHLKEGNYLRNIWQEHLCHLVNDEFLEMLADAAERIQPTGYLDMMEALHDELLRAREKRSMILRRYLDQLEKAMGAWIAALKT